MTKKSNIAALALGATLLITAGAAKADQAVGGTQTCAQQLAVLSGEWNAIDLQVSKPGQGVSRGQMGHSHSGAEVTFMQNQMRLASHRCTDGDEHESMLRMDVVRAIMKLPEVQHPADHHYTAPPR